MALLTNVPSFKVHLDKPFLLVALLLVHMKIQQPESKTFGLCWVLLPRMELKQRFEKRNYLRVDFIWILNN